MESKRSVSAMQTFFSNLDRRNRPPQYGPNQNSVAALGLAALVVFASGCASKTVYESQADREGIRNVVKAHLREVGKCYEDELEKVGLLEGKLVLSWDLDSEGRAENVQIKQGGPKIDPVAPCVIERLKTWRFPKPPSDEVVTVDYPFFFSENGNF